MHRRLCLGSLPIVTFHSVRPRGSPLAGADGALTLESDHFDRQMRSLARAGYRGVTCAQLLDHLQHGAAARARLPSKPVMLTFDDGYLDNWTTAFPILRRHGLRATIFVATDLLEKGDAVRPTTEQRVDPPVDGFLNPAELRALEASGVFEVQAHSASHARHASGPDTTCWFGEAPRWLPKLRRAETGAEQRARIAEDLLRARAALATILGHPVDFLAWPGGGTSPLALDVAIEQVGFRATFTCDRPSRGVEPSPRAIPRAFFSQQYRGPLAGFVRTQKLRGVVDFERGDWTGYARIFCANRLMRLLGGAPRAADVPSSPPSC